MRTGLSKGGGRGRTGTDAGVARGLAEEAVDEAHGGERGLRPAVRVDGALGVRAEGQEVLRARGEVVQRVREGLR